MNTKATIANFPPPHYIQRVRSVLERLKRYRMAPYNMPTMQEVEDALESLAEIERHLKQPQPERK